MHLYGSDTSPFARRIRMFAHYHQLDLPYTCLDIFAEEGRNTLVQHNPTRKIPFLTHDDLTIADSGLIMRYLTEHQQLPEMTWWQANQLVQIDACNDSLVELLICHRSGLDTSEDRLFFNLQYERIAALLSYLNEQCVKETFLESSYLKISLYCLLDWILFRDLYNLQDFAALVAFHQVQSNLPGVAQTDPRHS
ncbi:glutathione S-transferase family protein [Pseudoalteromonas phenolica]|uniref:glutathione S-transferase family protein n=1 Tax=Pseudoalteromonas phenolica TaxID=161398 RepID=UPI00384DD7B2